ncbi:MAG: twin-arginine translocation signal domain-containing protein [Candidatus Aminicenantes bacterium]|nr:twin-arginine translocation signal domain-containing protein [Candidatus Aminicenantes bacterium]
MKLTRRDFLSALGVGAVGSTLGSCRLPQRRERTNVLFIAIDDLNDWSTPILQ